MRYKKKPSVVEAEEFFIDGPNIPSVKTEGGTHYVSTKNGRTRLEPGDWVITDRKGRVSTMKPAEFRAEYEAVPGL